MRTRSFAVIGLLVIFALLLAVPVSADYVGESTGNFTSQIVNTYYEDPVDSSVSGGILDNIYFGAIERYNQGPLMLKMWAGLGTARIEMYCYGVGHINGNGPCGNYSVQTVTYNDSADNTVLGTGYVGYNINDHSDVYYWASINTWNIGTKTGPINVLMVFNLSNWYAYDHHYATMDLTNPLNVTFVVKPVSTWYPATADITTWANPHRIQFDSTYYFENSFDFTSGAVYNDLYINRIFGNIPYPSFVTLTGVENGIPQTYSMNSYGTTQMNMPNIPKTATNLHLQIEDLHGSFYNAYWNQTQQQQQVIIYTKDASTGQLIGGTTITIHNTTTGLNTYTGTSPGGVLYYTLPVGNAYTISGAKTGYTTATNSLSIAVYDANPIIVTLNMYPSEIASTGNGTQSFITENQLNPYQFDYIQGAAITVSNVTLGDIQTKYTNAQGWVAFVINNSYDYTYTASKSGFGGASGTLNMDGASVDTLTLIMNAPVTPTPTIPTGVVTTPTLASQQSAVTDVSGIFYNSAAFIAMLVIIAIIMGLVDMMTGGYRERYRRR
jgi:hypothetical protein